MYLQNWTCALSFWLISFLSLEPLSAQSFINVADSCGIYHYYGDGSGGGVSFYDFNGDGWDDLTFATSYNDPIHFYENQNGVFIRKDLLGVDNIYNSKHVIWVDFDNDDDPDLWVTSFYQNFLYRNTGDLIFEEVTAATQLPLTFEPTYGAAWGDYDRDGWLDLYVTDKKTGNDFKNVSNHLYRNIKGEYFEEVTQVSNAADSAKAPFCTAFLDINNNGWQDIYIAQDRIQGNSLLKNTGNGYYQDLSSSSGTNLRMNGMCVTVADFNNDEFLDIYVTNTPEGNALFKNNGDETFTENAGEAGVGFYETGWGSSFLDYDNDGLQDLYVCNSFGANKFYENISGGSFLEKDGGFENIAVSYSSATGDLNNDGLPDLVVNNANDFLSTLWLNQSNAENNWIKITLKGIYSNREGVGSRIVAYADDQVFTRYTHAGTGYLAQNSQHILIGTGQHPVLDSLKIYWLSGIIDTHYAIPVNQQISLTESTSLSAPPKLNLNGFQTICDTENFAINAGVFSDRLIYNWSTGEQDITIYPKESGQYFVDIEDAEGNHFHSDTLSLNLLKGPGVSDLILNNSSCYGSNDGSISFNITGGSPPYQTNWNSSNSYFRLDSLQKGVYEIIIIDSQGCTFEATYKINEPDPLSVTAFREHDIDSSSIGYIELDVNGGSPPYAFYWEYDLEEKSNALYDLLPGTYNVTVTDARGCSLIRQIEIYSFITTSRTAIDLADSIDLKIYPNPASDLLIIEMPNSTVTKIQLFDLNGQLMLEVKGTHRINIQNLSPGLYMVKINGRELRKLLIN